MKRRDARESALKILYALEFNDENAEAVIQRLTEEKMLSVSEFSRQIVNAYLKNKQEIDGSIVAHLQNWDYGRVAVIDKILLRMAVVEFMYFDAIPAEVTINEMIEIGKNFSTERSGKFINGVLDAILNRKHHHKKNKTRKK